MINENSIVKFHISNVFTRLSLILWNIYGKDPNFKPVRLFVRQVTTRLLQEGRHQELDSVKSRLDALHKAETEAAEAEVGAEQAEHLARLTDSMQEEYTDQLTVAYRDLLNKVRPTTETTSKRYAPLQRPPQ